MKIDKEAADLLESGLANKESGLVRAAVAVETALELAADNLKDGGDSFSMVISGLVALANLLDADGFSKEATALDTILKKANLALESATADRESKYNFKENNASSLYRSLENEPKLEATSPALETLKDSGVPALLTRHSPDHPGVNLLRVRDGVYQDQLTKKIYDFTKGFVDEFGRVHQGGSVANQTPTINSFAPMGQVLEDDSRTRR